MSATDTGSPYGDAYGGDGGDGRVRLEFDTYSGSASSPAHGSDGTWTE